MIWELTLKTFALTALAVINKQQLRLFCYSKNMETDEFVAHMRGDCLAARKERDIFKSQALLAVLNAVDNASAVDAPFEANMTEVARRELSIEDVREIIKNEIREMQEAAAIYKDTNTARADELAIKIAILNTYLKL